MDIIRNYLVFDGRQSTDFGVWISGGGTFNAPERDMETVSVPGRNGDLTFDNGRYKNLKVSYPAFINRDFDSHTADFREFLLSKIGYKRLEDSYHPEEYRMAMYTGGFSVKTTPRNLAGSFDLTFNCKPQRFLKAGEIPRAITANSSVMYNPTSFRARPLIRVYGTGNFTIAGINLVIVSQAGAYMDIDTELMDAFYGSVNCNSRITLTSGEFPVLEPGESEITKTSGITRLEITPRWWRL